MEQLRIINLIKLGRGSVTNKHVMPKLKDILIKDLRAVHGEDFIKKLKSETYWTKLEISQFLRRF